MENVLIIGAEARVDMVEDYLQQGAEVCAVYYEPNISMEKLTYTFDNLNLICISRQLSKMTDALRYLDETVRMPCRINDFSTVIYLR